MGPGRQTGVHVCARVHSRVRRRRVREEGRAYDARGMHVVLTWHVVLADGHAVRGRDYCQGLLLQAGQRLLRVLFRSLRAEQLQGLRRRHALPELALHA